jgi:adenylate cyclase
MANPGQILGVWACTLAPLHSGAKRQLRRGLGWQTLWPSTAATRQHGRISVSQSPKNKLSSNAPLLVAALATLACLALLALQLGGVLSLAVVDSLELDTIDARFLLRGPQKPANGDIVIVGFDDQLRREAPEVLQQRAGWARFLDALHTYRPRAVALDAFFSEPEEVLPAATVTQVQAAAQALELAPEATSTAGAAALAALRAVQDATRGDEKLAASLQKAGNILMSVLFFVDHGETDPAPLATPEPPGLRGARVTDAAVLERPAGQRPLRSEREVYGSLGSLARHSAGSGAVNVIRDVGGVVRRVPLVIDHAGRYYLPLGLTLAARSKALGLSQPAAASYATGDRELSLGSQILPVDSSAVARLGWLGPPGTFPHVSAADVLSGRAPKALLEDRLVIVGYTDAARDRVATPFAAVQPGVELHATLAHNAIHGGLLQASPAWLGLGVVALMGAAMTLLQLRRIRQRRTWLAALGGLGLGLAWLVAGQMLFERGVIVPLAAPLGSLLVIAVLVISTALVSEGREKAQLRRAFAHYVSGELVDRILADPQRVRLGGERRELSVLFSDIRGFSNFSEQMEPEALSGFLNEYLTPMTRIVLEKGGMLDKYIGDAVMAVFGAPLEMADHTAAMCQVALEMQTVLGQLRVGWQARGLPPIEIGVGLNAGPMSVGNMGSEMRFDYTVMGDAVNLASRLEGLTKEYRCAILCGPRVPELAGPGFVFREVDFVRVKGRGGALRVYELLGTRDNCRMAPEDLRLYAQALSEFRLRNWGSAELLLAELLARHPQDGPAQVLAARTRAMAAEPPEADWDGVYDQRNK